MKVSEQDMRMFDRYIRTELCLSALTIVAYKKDVEEFFTFIGEQSLNAQIIEKFISSLFVKNLKTTTIRRKCMSIRCLCHHLISNGLVDPKTIDSIDSVRIERGKPSVISNEDVHSLVSTMEKSAPTTGKFNIYRNIAIILVLYYSGIRVSELCGLNISDIDLDHRHIKVRGKGGHDRIVPITTECVEAIKRYMSMCRPMSPGFSSTAMFVKSNRYRITRRTVSDMIMSLSRRAGLQHITAHTLRGSCATFLMENGMELELVQALLGHRSLSTTQTYLGKVSDVEALRWIENIYA